MISSFQAQWTQGRIYTVLAVALLCGWALRVIHTTQAHQPSIQFRVDESDLDHRARNLLALPERSVLVQFYRMIGARIRMLDPRGIDALDPREVVMMLQPRAEAPEALATRLDDYVMAGGRLIVLTSAPLEMLSRFGIELVPRSDRSQVAVTTAGATYEGDSAQTLDFDAGLEVKVKDRSMLPLLVRGDGVCAGALVAHGKGSVIVVGGDPDRYSRIAREDNILFLTNLIVGPTQAGSSRQRWREPRDGKTVAELPPLNVLDLDPEILSQLYDLVKIRQQREQEAREKWNYDSLWSLIRANPVCAALVQLFIGFLFFLGARAHRLGDPLPESASLLAPLPALAPGWGAYLERSKGLALAADSAFEWHRRRLVRRLGLPTDADPKQIIRSLAEISPEHDETFKRFASLVTQIRRLPRSREQQGGDMLLEVWRTIDHLEKELGIS